MTRKSDLDMMGRSEAFDRQYIEECVLYTRGVINRMPPDVEFLLSIPGYHDDPRDLHEIPEVRLFIAEVAARLDLLRLTALSPITRTLVERCMGRVQ